MRFCKTFLKDVLSVPTVSCREERMREYIVGFAAEHGIACRQDQKGNLYLTKGVLKDGEYCPCLIEHIDTVQSWQLEFVDGNKRISILERKLRDGKTKLYSELKSAQGVNKVGLGADDKAGCAIALALLDSLDACKAVFCVEEEVGLRGSHEMDFDFLSDVSLCVTLDAPGRLRSATRGRRVRRNMYCQSFFDSVLKPISDRYGMDDFTHKADTDICNVMRNTKLVCWDLCNGGYKPHSADEYVVVEDAKLSYDLLMDLFASLEKNRQYTMPKGHLYESIEHFDPIPESQFTCECLECRVEGAPVSDRDTVLKWMEENLGPVVYNDEISVFGRPYVLFGKEKLVLCDTFEDTEMTQISLREIAQGCTDEVRELRIRADAGDAQSQYDLGMHYFSGHGVACDHSLFEKFVRDAASQGLEAAKEELRHIESWKQGLPELESSRQDPHPSSALTVHPCDWAHLSTLNHLLPV